MVWLANPMKLFDTIRGANLYFILIVIILYFINLLTKAFRWYLLVDSSGTKVSFKKTFPLYIISLALNNVTPGKIGGEPVRAYLLNKEAEVPIGQGIASIFAEKMMDIIVIATMAIIGAVFILPLLPIETSRYLVVAIILAIGGIIISVYIVSHSTLLNKTVDRSINFAMKVSKRDFVKRLSLALVGFVDRFKYGMNEILKARRSASACIFLTVIIWINEAIRLFLIILALPTDIDISIGVVFIASSIANVIGFAIPLGAGNILGIPAVLVIYGISNEIAVTTAFLQTATSIWISVPLGAAAILITGLKVYKVSKSNNKAGTSDSANKKTKHSNTKESTIRITNPNNKKVKLPTYNPKKV